VGNPEGKRPVGRPRRRWKDNSKMNIKRIVCGSMDWINRPQDSDQWRAYVNTTIKLRVS
jgi:hypothetical protein